ncbi:MAG TPA: fibronectin type III domain-containing protein, partial [Thermoanaerobaculia bacterium]|nr:fibronectin type III domain-containing protein [Thermoanaerobaculia bacterium]
AVIFNSSFFNKDASPAYSLKSAVIDPTREVIVQAPRTLLSYGTTVGTVLWNGSEYVAAYSFAPSPPSNLTQVMLQRISRAGEPVDAPLLLSTVPLGPLTPTVVTSNGHEYLVTLGKSFVRIPIGSRNPTAPAELARLVDAQEGLAFARGRQDFLAVWRETDRSGATIRASRVDAKGRYLDGTGVVIATFPDDVGPPGSYVPATVSVDSDGQNWLVVWSYASHVWGCRVSAAGVMLDTKPIAIAAASGATVRWGGTSWLVVSTNTRQLATTTVTSDGLAGPVKVFDEISADVIVPNGWQAFYTYPLLAFDGEQFVFAAGLETYGGGIDSVAIVTERLGLSGDPIGGSKFILPPEIGRGNGSSLATNGSQDLIVFESWASGPSFQGLLLNRGHAPVTITIDAPQPIAWDTSWNGNEFIVAANTQDGGVQLKHLSRLGVARDTITLPRYSGEFTHGVVFPPSSPARPSTLAGSDLPLGLRTRHDAYAGVSREELAFAGDVADSQLQQVEPAAPVLIKAIGDPMGVTLSWQPQDNVLGFEIELRQSDGTDRVVGIAAGSTSSTHIAYGGLTGTTINLRAWNAAGLSAPSPDLQITTPRVRAAAK